VNDFHYRAEAVYQSPILIAILFKRLLPILKLLKDIFRRLPPLEIGSERVLREVYPSLFGVIGQGIDDQFKVFSGGWCLSSRRHEENGLFTVKFFRLEGGSGGKENKGSGYRLMVCQSARLCRLP